MKTLLSSLSLSLLMLFTFHSYADTTGHTTLHHPKDLTETLYDQIQRDTAFIEWNQPSLLAACRRVLTLTGSASRTHIENAVRRKAEFEKWVNLLNLSKAGLFQGELSKFYQEYLETKGAPQVSPVEFMVLLNRFNILYEGPGEGRDVGKVFKNPFAEFMDYCRTRSGELHTMKVWGDRPSRVWGTDQWFKLKPESDPRFEGNREEVRAETILFAYSLMNQVKKGQGDDHGMFFERFALSVAAAPDYVEIEKVFSDFVKKLTPQ